MHNPSLKLFLAIIVALEITFTTHLYPNVIIIVLALAYLLYHHTQLRHLMWLLLITAIPAIAIFTTIAFFSPQHSIYFGLVLVTRIYVYVTAGSAVSLTTSPLQLARSLEQNCHLPSKFAYGVLAALNLLPKIQQEVKTIRIAGQLRGVTFHWWSPTLYFKAILAASQWADQLAQAMESHGFTEGAPRTTVQPITITKQDWGLFISGLVLVQVIIIALP